ncbi:hypothetical protein PR202_ga31026 [Eleusine coracana subsp. coracana]|uniref:Uncharacterized protein n=1 Tax=Eleusine coracana subsp. coracana TaxID=191504 RepID=A0AAV5DR87_ELECO|nr:hypothetical protein PR202_ga31026 [Eleusine coracana subsp. coracana]
MMPSPPPAGCSAAGTHRRGARRWRARPSFASQGCFRPSHPRTSLSCLPHAAASSSVLLSPRPWPSDPAHRPVRQLPCPALGTPSPATLPVAPLFSSSLWQVPSLEAAKSTPWTRMRKISNKGGSLVFSLFNLKSKSRFWIESSFA